MSSLPVRGWIYMLVPVIGLGLGGEALAEKKVDWTPYLEKPGERTKARPTPQPAEVTPKKKTKARPKQRAAQAPTKAKAKPKAKRRTARKRR